MRASVARRWRTVTMEELRKIWADLQARNEWYNGCTHAELIRLYGSANIKHVSGYGWYRLQ
jgi:hypothetical protein